MPTVIFEAVFNKVQPHCRRPIFLVIVIWLAFLARGVFYCSFMPLWEGYDEWAHFGFVERLVNTGHALVDRTDPVSFEVQRSMELAPAPWQTGKPYTTEDAYWSLSSEQRATRMQELQEMPARWSWTPDPAGAPIYEALQPPLYYWISSVAYRLLANDSLLTRVFVLRYLSVLICSLAIPIIYLLALRVSNSAVTALLVISLVAILPELMIDISRMGNECLAIPVYAWLTLLLLPNNKFALHVRHATWTGVALGLGLLTKAYFLTAIPALGIIFLGRTWKSPNRKTEAWQFGIGFGTALLIGGWWYLHNRITTGTWSGLLESTRLVHYSSMQFVTGAKELHWRSAVDSILLSHIWFGGWSSLHIRSWMYHLIYCIAAVGVLGVIAELARRTPQAKLLFPLVTIYGFFWLGQLYNVLLLFLTKGAATSMGWYMYSVVGAEVTLLVIGLGALIPIRLRSWAIASLILLFGALDVYSVHFVSIPYYVGLTSHGSDGSLVAFRVGQLHGFGVQEVFTRLSGFKPAWLTAPMIGVEWAAYLIATLLLIALPFWLALRWRSVTQIDSLQNRL